MSNINEKNKLNGANIPEIANNMQMVNENDLDNVNGGYVYERKDATNAKHRFAVIEDETGDMIGKYSTLEKAQKEARRSGNKKKLISKEKLDKIRSRADNEEW